MLEIDSPVIWSFVYILCSFSYFEVFLTWKVDFDFKKMLVNSLETDGSHEFHSFWCQFKSFSLLNFEVCTKFDLGQLYWKTCNNKNFDRVD